MEGDSRDMVQDVHHVAKVRWRFFDQWAVCEQRSQGDQRNGSRLLPPAVVRMRLTNAQQRTRMKEREKLCCCFFSVRGLFDMYSSIRALPRSLRFFSNDH